MRIRLIGAAALLLALLAPCAVTAEEVAPTYFGKDVSTAKIGGPLHMTDQNGRRRSFEDFRGKVVVIFFGYTRCPDVCPTTLSRMAQVMRLLGPDAERTQVLWVTVDPKRDTQALLHNFIPHFDARFLGLRGTLAQTESLAKSFHVGYQILKYQGTFLVDHSPEGYLIDPAGVTRLKLPYDMTAEQIAADVRTILGQQ